MARINLEITGDATGLQNAAKKATVATNGLTKATGMSKAQLEAWDAAARRNSMEQYASEVRGATVATKGLAAAQGNLSAASRGLTNNIRGANTVGIEFSRIIQDAPYGIIGVGNNITQLTQSFANLRAQTSSTGQALGIAFRSMFSGANLLVLGVSAATTAFTLYNMWARKNKKDTDALANGTKTYIETLEGLQRALADGQIAANKDLEQLRLLYEATQNLTLPMESRRKAADELIKQYPKQFEGMNTEAVLAGEAASAYTKLTQSITATAMAMASLDKIRENSNKILNNRLQIIDKQNEANRIAQQIEKENDQVLTDEAAIQRQGTVNALTNQRTKLLQEINDLGRESGELNDVNSQLQQEWNSQIAEGADLSGKVTGNLGKSSKSLSDAVKLQESLLKLQQESILASLDGNARELQASSFKFDELRKQADEYYREGRVKAKEYANYLARLQGFEVAERAGIVGPALMAPSRGLTTTGVVPAQLPNQIAKVDLGSDPVWDALIDDLDKQLSRSVQHFGRDFMRTLSTINQQANVTFGGIVSNLVGSFTGGISEVLNTTLLKGLEGVISNVFKPINEGGIGKWGTYGVAGLGIVGAGISGIADQKNTGLQALGGGLSGAAAGTAILPGIGTAIGAVVGAIGGILGASSARKIEQEQLAEQRKQTALLERQNALAYASSIIGQMTAGGAVTGIMRDAFGQLVASVRGDQLEFVLQRSGGNR